MQYTLNGCSVVLKRLPILHDLTEKVTSGTLFCVDAVYQRNHFSIEWLMQLRISSVQHATGGRFYLGCRVVDDDKFENKIGDSEAKIAALLIHRADFFMVLYDPTTCEGVIVDENEVWGQLGKN
jgi:hypothetical protein